MIAVGGLVAGIGALMQSHTPELHAAVILGAVGVVLLIGGGITAAVASRDYAITERHADTLKAAVNAVEVSIETGHALTYGDADGYTIGRDSFRRHFKRLRLNRRWELLIRDYGEAVVALQTRVHGEATDRFPHPQYRTWYIADFIHALTVRRARSGDEDSALTWRGSPQNGKMSPQGDPAEDWITLEALPGETWEAWWERGDPLRQEVDHLGREAQTWPEAAAVKAAYERLQAAKGQLLHELRLIREKWPPPAVWRCPGC